MKHFSFEQLPNAVSQLHEKIEFIEMYLRKENSSYKNVIFLKKTSLESKCNSNFNKSDLAQLFYILMDESILFFDDKNEKLNRSMMQQFLQENFTYNGELGFQVAIIAISKQFSESKGYTYREKQLKFLDKIIWLFQKRREKLLEW